jgi:hypothetical protein
MEERERREDRDDEDLQELKRRRNRDRDDDAPRHRRAVPTIEKFQVWFDFDKSTVTADYSAPEGFSADDLERFIDDLRADGFRLYRKQSFDKRREPGQRRGRDYER